MRINRFIAASSDLSRRAADQALLDGRVAVNGKSASVATEVKEDDLVTLDGKPIKPQAEQQTILLNKPEGYVVSREGQGSETIFDLLPPEMHNLKPVGRLDKQSSGLLLLTSDGELAHRLTHPSFQKAKVYQIALDKPLQPLHHQMIADIGVQLDDGPSRLGLERIGQDGRSWQVAMHEGRNRQIRRTFGALGYEVTHLHRTRFGSYTLPEDLVLGNYRKAASH